MLKYRKDKIYCQQLLVKNIYFNRLLKVSPHIMCEIRHQLYWKLVEILLKQMCYRYLAFILRNYKTKCDVTASPDERAENIKLRRNRSNASV